MKKYILDTNVLLRFLLRDVEEHFKKARALFLEADGEKVKLIIPQIVVFEIQFALEKFYALKKREAIEKIESFISAKNFEIESNQVFKEAVEIYKEKNLSFVDCFLIAKGRLENTPVFSFDRKLLLQN
ncbi:hypothetical protein A3D00_04430 [Candidatus Woesebacteria bacterium RIFCSPHIGHO2_02_FULL_38_9]|uniref:PIN domain-containing protein n=1 Tax=Candidatus Woesebacteria bacterium RIFCSPHIGHO2_01_FULL_39_28 TaxID=1802496 RepID=A0A1F7YGA5_9BACT|nr:MAG: hypothetical protein A2627_05785 [Candidatus Woesebacteria bacterium RIFCSPHIGHO2_01_FULL_39_28]OGM34938.1 MAG: hypothetical protein A3D00_04430 [Candidatus Woesebacteria bacterium RIFCSPHIGHO2_02_FULL_38_9]OGM57459.1 MAG: hypothetical protein A3A50_06020 [Candidatus Woesebacteria bacterium RIFCSPLOWO2_01_FULL_38_20]